MADYGGNCVRLRLFVQPVLGRQSCKVHDLACTVALAKRAKATTQAILLDLHHSDTFADPPRAKDPRRL
jgi:arabinogalactan endo-1,4-beta-galactosidase